MGDNEHRQIARDSLFVLADLRVDGLEGDHRIRVRNIGWVEGSVAWVQDSRFGIAFREDIDPRVARAPSQGGEEPEFMVRRSLYSSKPAPGSDVRKI
jgi:hypothetical protein